MAGPNGVAAPAEAFRVVGATGLQTYSGLVAEDYLRELQGPNGVRVYRQMESEDALIGGLLYAVRMLLRAVEWHTAPAADAPEAVAVAQFVDDCRHDMSQSWPATIDDILSMNTYGWAALELCYKRRRGYQADVLPRPHARPQPPSSRYNDGRIGWRKWMLLGQDTLDHWEIDAEGGIQGLHQLAPPDYRPAFIPIAKLLLFRTWSRKGNPEGTSLLRTAYRCFSADTEMLTARGWVSVADVNDSDDIATLNPDTNQLEYHRPAERHAYPYRGELFHQVGKHVDLLVTPNHRMWVRREGKAHFEFIEADALPRKAWYQRHAQWQGQEQAVFELPAHTFGPGQSGGARTKPALPIPMDAWLRFLGIWTAEGCTWRRNTGTRQADVIVTQNAGAKADRIRAWLTALPFRVYEHVRGNKIDFTISSVQLWAYLRQFGKAGDKRVPDEVKRLSARQIRLFLEAHHLGDGSHNHTARTHFTISKRLADDLSELVLKAGGVANVRWQPHVHGFGVGVWVVTEMQARSGGNRCNAGADRRARVPYDGMVYCVTVPNHLVYVRRNGKACWSGNSWYFKRRLENLEGTGIERDLVGLPLLEVPPEIVNPQTDAERTIQQNLMHIGRNLKNDEQAFLLWPLVYDEKGNSRYRFSLVNAPGSRAFDMSGAIARWNQAIAMSVLLDVLLLGHEAVGSYALAESKTQLFVAALKALVDSIAGVINAYAIPRLCHLNGWDHTLYPTVVPGAVYEIDPAQLVDNVAKLTQAGFAFDAEAQQYVFRRIGVPVAEPAPAAPPPAGPPGDSSETPDGAGGAA